MRIELAPVHPYVRLRHVRFSDLPTIAEAIEQVMSTGSYDGDAVDFLDGVVFSRGESYLCLGTWADHAPRTSDYTGREIYYRSLRTRSSDCLTVRDYLWRWDTDWFWCSRAFGAQNPLLRRVWPKRLLRSDVYSPAPRAGESLSGRRAAGPLASSSRPRAGRAGRRDPGRRGQPSSSTGSSVRFRIEPIWLCPIRLRDNGSDRGAGRCIRCSPECTMSTSASGRPSRSLPGAADGDVNRAIEAAVTALGRPQVALLRCVLQPRGVLRPLRRRRLPSRQGGVRPGWPARRPLREGGDATMTTIGVDAFQSVAPGRAVPVLCV